MNDRLHLAAQAAYELLSTGIRQIADKDYCVVTELADALASREEASYWRPVAPEQHKKAFAAGDLMALAEEAGGARMAENVVQVTRSDIERIIYFAKEAEASREEAPASHEGNVWGDSLSPFIQGAPAAASAAQTVARWPTVVTEAMHVAACKVLLRASGMDGLPQRMLDAMLAVAPASTPEAKSLVNDNFAADWLTSGASLHPHTINLVVRFARALAAKLAAAEVKYGYSDGWLSPEWMGECRAKLQQHITKGDPRDVAAYCAFLWHHGESTAAPEAAETASTEALTDEQIIEGLQDIGIQSWGPRAEGFQAGVRFSEKKHDIGAEKGAQPVRRMCECGMLPHAQHCSWAYPNEPKGVQPGERGEG